MSKLIAVGMVCVLLASSATLATGPALGGALQDQTVSTLMVNEIGLFHGTQTANSANWAAINNVQNAVGQCGLLAYEKQMGFVSQVGSACGQCSLIGLDQIAEVMGIQGQIIGSGVAPKTELQTLFVSGSQMLSKTDGAGSVTGDQIISLSQDQSGANATGPMNQASTVFGSQNANIQGAPGATGVAGSSLTVITAQEQTVM